MSSYFKVKQSMLEPIQHAVAAEIDVMPGQIEVDVIKETAYVLMVRLKASIAAEKLSKQIEFRHVEPATWWDHLKKDNALFRKVFGEPKMKDVVSTVDVSFNVCFPDYVIPRGMGKVYVATRVDAVTLGDENTAYQVEEKWY